MPNSGGCTKSEGRSGVLPMYRWSKWRPFPDPRRGGVLVSPIGPGVYELRNAATGELVLFGRCDYCASRMSSPLPGGGGTRKNTKKRKYVRRHLNDIEYRTRACASHQESFCGGNYSAPTRSLSFSNVEWPHSALMGSGQGLLRDAVTAIPKNARLVAWTIGQKHGGC